MLEALKAMENYDIIFFTPHEENEDEVSVQSATYKTPGEKIGGTEMGDFYDIVLFRMDEEDELIDLERFQAILVDPRVYVGRMVKSDYFGMVAKKTTNSDNMVDDIFAKWASY